MGSDDDGYFVCAKVNEKPVTMLCDSGANVIILNSSLLNRSTWKDSVEPSLSPVNTMLLTITGQSKPFLGKAVVKICLGKCTFQHEVLFADLTQDHGILGINYPLAQQSCGGDIGSVPYVCMLVRTYVRSYVHLL